MLMGQIPLLFDLFQWGCTVVANNKMVKSLQEWETKKRNEAVDTEAIRHLPI